ncbi:hypothetical protein Clacol_000376 [Clathrus columnatus]|uniref:Glutathione hydrolase n=1 Tax=Clathrus columnatus TaxID=1419009 RepID=A0AAV4ZYA9_9AGAM|nr:hypothetical protein Clacol_000376 [Clathrus columnatus]
MSLKEELPLLADDELVKGDSERTDLALPRWTTSETTPDTSFTIPLSQYSNIKRSRVWKRFAVIAAFVLSISAFFIWDKVNERGWMFCVTSSATRNMPARPTLPGWPAKSNPAYLIRATRGAVATENKLCSDIGVDVLKDGGNALDAGIAAVLCTGTVNMFSSGIGGGGFMTIRLPPTLDNPHSEGWTVDFRETAPAAANSTMFRDNPDSSRFGGLSVGVPGELRGLAEAHRRWGKLSWKRLVTPSAKLAAGWEIFEQLMLGNPDWKAIFAPQGKLLMQGDLIHRTNYSRTLYQIAEHGAEAFYSGPILDAMLHKINQTGGVLTEDDFASYGVLVEPALKGSFKSRTVYTSHAPTSGPVLLLMLNLLEKFDDSMDNPLFLHRFIETLKFGFAARTRIADPAFLNDTHLIDEVSTKAYASEIFSNITDDTTHPPEYYNPIFDMPSDHGTVRQAFLLARNSLTSLPKQSHTSVVDSSGMAVSITSTVNLVFGSQVMDPITGVILNDELDDFSTPGVPNGFGLWPSPYNYPAPGKRPLSSTAPTIVEHRDGSLYLVLGGSGGSKIFGAVAHVILGADDVLLKHEQGNKADWIDVSQAVEAPRAHDQLYPLATEVDSTFDQVSLDVLISKGHNITVSDINRVAAVVQAILVKDGQIFEHESVDLGSER